MALKGTTYLTVEETEPQSKRNSRAKNGQKSEIKHVQIALLARRDTPVPRDRESPPKARLERLQRKWAGGGQWLTEERAAPEAEIVLAKQG